VRDGGKVLQRGAAKRDVRDADELRSFINRFEDALEWNGHAIDRRDGNDLRTLPCKAMVDVIVRGKVQAIGDQFVSGTAPVEARSNDRLADGSGAAPSSDP